MINYSHLNPVLQEVIEIMNDSDFKPHLTDSIFKEFPRANMVIIIQHLPGRNELSITRRKSYFDQTGTEGCPLKISIMCEAEHRIELLWDNWRENLKRWVTKLSPKNSNHPPAERQLVNILD